jgi:hypothetical protein
MQREQQFTQDEGVAGTRGVTCGAEAFVRLASVEGGDHAAGGRRRQGLERPPLGGRIVGNRLERGVVDRGLTGPARQQDPDGERIRAAHEEGQKSQ